MSEKEIIEIIKDFLELREIHSSDSMTKSYLSVYKEAIQSLLNLYNKEKEKNKKQEKQIEKLLNIKLYACDENKNKECNKKHCYINGGECDGTTDITKVKYINLDEYISKDKIRGKIKELEEKIHVVTPDTHIIEKITEFKKEGALNILQELLEEE